jgi:hypothetical protein
MPKNQVTIQAQNITNQTSPRLLGAVTLGAIAGVFIGLLAMAFAILISSIVQLVFPDLSFQVAGMSITAVIFVIFLALGWCGSTLLIWHKLPKN